MPEAGPFPSISCQRFGAPLSGPGGWVRLRSGHRSDTLEPNGVSMVRKARASGSMRPRSKSMKLTSRTSGVGLAQAEALAVEGGGDVDVAAVQAGRAGAASSAATPVGTAEVFEEAGRGTFFRRASLAGFRKSSEERRAGFIHRRGKTRYPPRRVHLPPPISPGPRAAFDCRADACAQGETAAPASDIPLDVCAPMDKRREAPPGRPGGSAGTGGETAG